MRKGFPKQIKYIIGNEAAERFSYYGMSSLLTLYMVNHYGYGDRDAETTYHLFVSAVYFTPLLGAYLADRFWGKYRTIITLSLVYVAGHATLALWPGLPGLFTGLGLIALGAGGIKPCVAAHAGDQFTQANKELVPRAFSLFYWSINFGSFFAYVVIPWTKGHYGYSVAFAIPGALMAVATFVFWSGRGKYIYVPPTGGKDDTPGKVLLYLLTRGGAARARHRFGDQKLDEALSVVRVTKVLVPVIVFWALYFQTASSWVLTSKQMNLHGFLEPEMVQASNPVLIMILAPLFASVLYPALERRGYSTSPVRRIGVGLFCTAGAFVGIAVIQFFIDRGTFLSVFWFLIPYSILTAGEVLVSMTALEFAYTQAPRSAKSTVQSIWLLTMAFGSLLTAVFAQLDFFDGAAEYLFWAGLMAATGVLFVAFARGYHVVDYVEPEAEPGAR